MFQTHGPPDAPTTVDGIVGVGTDVDTNALTMDICVGFDLDSVQDSAVFDGLHGPS